MTTGREASPWGPPVEVEAYGLPYVSKDWNGLMKILHDVYPADIFTGSSGDLGPRLIALLREIDEATHA